MPRNLLSLLVIVALTTLFIVFWDSPPERFLRTKAAEEKPSKFPKTYLTDVETTQYNEQGNISYTFNAAKVSYFQHNKKRKTKRDYTLLDAPDIVMFDPSRPPWHVTAKHGRTNASGSHIKLWGNVKIWQTNAAGERAELTTSQLVVKPDQQYAETDKPVMISTADGETRAVGMKAFLKQDKIQLLSQVRGVHEAI